MGCDVVGNPKGAKFGGGLYKFNMFEVELRGRMVCEGATEVNDAEGEDV
jgi:hypothetical protein